MWWSSLETKNSSESTLYSSKSAPTWLHSITAAESITEETNPITGLHEIPSGFYIPFSGLSGGAAVDPEVLNICTRSSRLMRVRISHKNSLLSAASLRLSIRIWNNLIPLSIISKDLFPIRSWHKCLSFAICSSVNRSEISNRTALKSKELMSSTSSVSTRNRFPFLLSLPSLTHQCDTSLTPPPTYTSRPPPCKQKLLVKFQT